MSRALRAALAALLVSSPITARSQPHVEPEEPIAGDNPQTEAADESGAEPDSEAPEAEPDTPEAGDEADATTDEEPGDADTAAGDANDAGGTDADADTGGGGDDALDDDPFAKEPLPPPGPPRAGDQAPSPVLDRPPAIEPLTKVELGATAGVGQRPSSNDRVSYEAGPIFGAHVRLNLARWMGVRLVGRFELGGARSSMVGAEDLDLERLYLGAHAEPTWVVVDRLALLAIVGIGWARTTTDPKPSPETVGERVGVLLEVPLGAGATYEIIEDWLILGAMGNVGFVFNQSGDLFEPVQAVDASGSRMTLEPLPEFGTSWAAVAALGVLL